MAEVSLKGVYKIYPGDKGHDVTAVRDFNMDILDREFVVFVGPSGCGKSTTLRMIAGLEEISRGQISIGGKVVNDIPPKDRDIAMVFQNYALYPHMSVFDNMAFGLKLRKFPKKEIRNRVDEAAAILGLEALLDRKPKALSGGQRQRVALGRAIVRQPKVFLFDEPLSNLDAKMRVQMRAEIIKLHRRLHATMIYVTHDQVEAMTMGERIVVMDAVVNPETGLKEGVVQQIDAPLKLYNHPANTFVAGFLGTPPMNLLHGTLRRNGEKVAFLEKDGGSVRLEIPKEAWPANFRDGDILLGFRPEDCDIIRGGDVPAGETFKASVDLAEPMGSETHLTLSTGPHSVVCKCHEEFAHGDIGSSLTFRVNTRKIHLFDPKTGQRCPVSNSPN